MGLPYKTGPNDIQFSRNLRCVEFHQIFKSVDSVDHLCSDFWGRDKPSKGIFWKFLTLFKGDFRE